MEKLNKYSVAGHSFAVILPEELDPEIYLKPYIPFAVSDDSEPLFELSIAMTDSLKDVQPGQVRECLNEESPYFWIFQREDGGFNFGFSYTKAAPDCILVPSDDFRKNVVYIRKQACERTAEFALSNSMMLLYTFCTSAYDTLMVHASVINHAGGGYMFLGKSGTGKSTHSRLWLSHIDDTDLLNDDNPVIRIVDGNAYIYGTPWSGKTPCYKNQSVPLKAVVRLSQAPYNKIMRQAPLHAFASLMPACSCMRWENASVTMLHKTVEKVIASVPSYHLECLPDEAAARLCHKEVTRK